MTKRRSGESTSSNKRQKTEAAINKIKEFIANPTLGISAQMLIDLLDNSSKEKK